MTEGDGGDILRRCSETTSTTARSNRAGRCCSIPYSVSGLSDAGRTRDDDLGLQQFDVPPHALGPRPNQGGACAARAGGAQTHRGARGHVRVLGSGRVGRRHAGRPQRDRLRQPHHRGTVDSCRPARPEPAGSCNPSTGYLATMVNGEVVRRHDEDTGARPGVPAAQRPRATSRCGSSTSWSSAPASAGLASALALARAGHRVTLVERDDAPMPADVGGRLRVGPHGRASGAPSARVPRAGPHHPAAIASLTCCRRCRTSASNRPRSATTRACTLDEATLAVLAGRRRPAHAPVPAHDVRVGHAPHRAGRTRCRAPSSGRAYRDLSSKAVPKDASGHRGRARGRHNVGRRRRRRHDRTPQRPAGVVGRARPEAAPKTRATPVSSTSRASTVPTTTSPSDFARSARGRHRCRRDRVGRGHVLGDGGRRPGRQGAAEAPLRLRPLRRHHATASRARRRDRHQRRADPPRALDDGPGQSHTIVHRQPRRHRSSPGCSHAATRTRARTPPTGAASPSRCDKRHSSPKC